MYYCHFFAVIFLLCQTHLVRSNEPLLVVDPEETAETTKLPNAHSAAFVMGFILLCVLCYGLYRACRGHCGANKMPLTVNLEVGTMEELGAKGLEDYITEREAYMAIYGSRRDSIHRDMESHVCEFKPREKVKDTRQMV
ncbi:hypothetical protein JTE90_008755 [Oedothorax gibbosus]|uniref:Uncharacterized protein n=1 Tax=Oedothorax gibbosus TaxID=931172 RepID=A0AAV6UR03_9ARAC|nr:hypothetical protein JTE90_008755 [Oedothorax gibbosus]